jgi:hypothetical protein
LLRAEVVELIVTNENFTSTVLFSREHPTEKRFSFGFGRFWEAFLNDRRHEVDTRGCSIINWFFSSGLDEQNSV